MRRSIVLCSSALNLFIIAIALSVFAEPRQASVADKPALARPPARVRAKRLHTVGVAYMTQQSFEKALALFEQAYAADPGLLSARLNQGIALLNLQRFDAAREALTDAVRLQPSNPRGWYNLGLLYRNSGDAERALEAFARAAELDPADADIHYFLGTLHTQENRLDQAIRSLKRATELVPNHVSAQFALARAYQRAGEREKARQHLARFDELSKNKLGAPISLIYGEQGRYSLVEQTEPAPAPPSSGIPVRFTAVTTEAGLGHAASGDSDNDVGAGACFLDFDNDDRPDLLLLGGRPAARLYKNAATGRFIDVTKSAGLDVAGRARACAVGDFDNDLHADLAISFDTGVRLLRSAEGRFEDVTDSAGIKPSPGSTSVTFVDYDHDGDLDLYVSGSGGRHGVARTSGALWRNNGNLSFTDVTDSTGLGDSSAFTAVLTDVNSDRAVDFVVGGGTDAPRTYLNPREGKFIPAGLAKGDGDVLGIAVLDFDKDSHMDLALTHAGRPGLTLLRNARGRSFEPFELPSLDWERAWGVAAFDYDNDGWLDLVAVGQSRHRAELRVFRNLGPKGFVDVSKSVAADALRLHSPRTLITADYDRDGDTDLLITQVAGLPVLLRNQGGSRNEWLRVRLQGLNDNKSAIGAKVEVFAGTMWQKWEAQGASGYLGQSASEIIVGLGREREADVLRLLWPTGVVQDEIQLSIRKTHAVTEIDRRGSSCPVLFAWDGQRFGFITDFIGAGIVGHWVGPDTRNAPDPDEYVKIDGSSLRPQGGKFRLRIVEPMEEVVFLDRVRLFAVDHPEGTEVNPNEYFAGAPPFAEFKLFTSHDAVPPRRATADGVDVTELLLHRDRRLVAEFRDDAYRGFARLHSLELELPEPYSGGPLRMSMHGLTDYFTATSVYAAHQAGITPVVPYVEARTTSGEWIRIPGTIGFPAGLLRTMIADLTAKIPPGTTALRITTNLKIYWDQILIDTSEDTSTAVHEAPLSSAHVRFRGYPREQRGALSADVAYSYDEISRSGPYARHSGAYTRYGDVRELLSAAEDKFVILGSGDEIALEFDADLPAPPAGWKRDYLFFGHGYSKDMDFYEAHSATVEPLPYEGMASYPYRRERAADDAYLQYRLEVNTRHNSGSAEPVYRFNFPRTSKPSALSR